MDCRHDFMLLDAVALNQCQSLGQHLGRWQRTGWRFWRHQRCAANGAFRIRQFEFGWIVVIYFQRHISPVHFARRFDGPSFGRHSSSFAGSHRYRKSRAGVRLCLHGSTRLHWDLLWRSEPIRKFLLRRIIILQQTVRLIFFGMQGRHYSVRDSRRCVHLCLVWITYIFLKFWWIGRKMTGRWAGWVPSWRLCLRATKNTRWAAAETAEAKKNIMTEWNNRVMISLDKKWTAITIYWLSDTFQQIQLILFSFFFLKYFPFSNFCANLIKISTSYPISILTDCYLWILCFNLFDGFYFSSSRKICLRVSRQSYATRLVSFLLSLISFQCVSFSLPELFGSSSFSFCLCFFASLFSPLL